jgi:imidazolonepropionase-like amidohydrolase
MLACTLGDSGRSGGEARERSGSRDAGGGDRPGTRARSVAMLRQALIEAQAYTEKRRADATAPLDLGQEALAAVLRREVPLLITAHRAQDLMSALRVAQEFELQIVLDGAAESYAVAQEIQRAGCWVLPHPALARTSGELQNGTMELPKLLADAGIPFALQSGFEGYVPKTRVVLFEAGVSVGKGLPAERALAALTIDAARLLGVQERIGSLEAGKDADLAWFDGDPFEYTSHCLGVAIDGVVHPGESR